MSKNSNSLLAFLTGAATGAVMGILYAPDKGENTRDRLSFLLDKYRKKLDEVLDEFMEGKEQLSENSNEAKEEGQKIVNDAKEKAEKLLDDVNGLLDQIKAD
ncbi:YtxH domain-containing protein [Reichenbachiella versicolor]|uniref:YtxH domain-containing protein n=1 Tax=Reichenbachiella versicolor TaxID=1821036 RepID=UPI000D6EA794|nr:YtxH domain-containing protein [Reichenbachiella versicolor]